MSTSSELEPITITITAYVEEFSAAIHRAAEVSRKTADALNRLGADWVIFTSLRRTETVTRSAMHAAYRAKTRRRNRR